MKEQIIIVGVGETADIAFEYITYDAVFDVVAFAVNKEYIQGVEYSGKPLVALEDITEIYPPDRYKTFVAMSSGKLNQNRQCVFEYVKSLGYSCVSYVSPHAFVWRTAKIGENCFIFENNVIQHDVQIGDNVVLWSGNHIGHQTTIKNNVFISSHCVISGFCEIGENSFLGVNCTFADHITIGRDCFIGMGAVVAKNLSENTLIKSAKSELAKFSAKQLCQIE